MTPTIRRLAVGDVNLSRGEGVPDTFASAHSTFAARGVGALPGAVSPGMSHVSMMRVRFSIPARLLVGFVANLALVALGFWLVFRAQFGASSGDLFASIAEPRVQALTERLGAELRAQPRSDWDRVLAGHTKALGIEFSLYDGDLRTVAGPALELPKEVMERIGELTPHGRDRADGRRPPPPPRADDEGLGGGQRRPQTPEETALFGAEDFLGGGRFGPPPSREGRPPPREGWPPPGGGPPDRAPSPQPMDPELTSYPKITAHSSNPSAYWVVSRVPVFQSERGWLPLLLVMRSDSLTAGGLFFDPKPWLYAGLGVLLLSAFIWVPLALGLTRSLWRIRTATSRIAEGDFAVAVPDSARADELGELGRSVKQMAQRLADHVTGQKRFMGDIAHELCSPFLGCRHRSEFWSRWTVRMRSSGAISRSSGVNSST